MARWLGIWSGLFVVMLACTGIAWVLIGFDSTGFPWGRFILAEFLFSFLVSTVTVVMES